MAVRTRGANALAEVPTQAETEAETPVIPIRQSNLIIANGTDRLPRYLLDWDKTQAALREPFDPDDIYFLPQTVDYKNNTAIAAAYADSRVYSARMNLVIGAGFWQSKVDRVDVAAFTKVIKAKLDWKAKDEAGNAKVLEPARDVAGNKVGVTDRVGIWMGPMLGWVWHDSTGAKDTADENWITTGEAQAYKRAMTKWGPGEYLYHLPKQSCPYDTRAGRWKQQPVIPDWAYPNHVCADCDAVIEHYNYTDKDGNTQSRHFWDIVTSTRSLYGRQLCAGCAKKARAAQTAPETQQRLQ